MITREDYLDSIKIWRKSQIGLANALPVGYNNMKKSQLKAIVADFKIPMGQPTKTIKIKRKKPYVPKDRTKTNEARDKKLKEIRKGGGAGRPKKTDKRMTREDVNRMRDAELARLKK